MSSTNKQVCLDLFSEELNDISKLVETPNLMREVALSGIDSVLEQSPAAIKQKLDNTKKILENITDESIKQNYKIIYSQMLILAVSSMEAILKKYLRDEIIKMDKINNENSKLEEIKLNAKKLLDYNFNSNELFCDLLLEKENSSFQNLKLIKETFEDYLNIKFVLNNEDEKKLIFYLELRHVLVHKSGKIDKRFINSTSKMNANIKNYKLYDDVNIEEEEWNMVKDVFIKLVKNITTA